MIYQNDTAARIRTLYDDGGDPPFSAVLDHLRPATDAALGEVIELDGRLRLTLGRDVALDRYLVAEQIESKMVALDAAIEMALRASSRSSAPSDRDVEMLVGNYPRFERPIREAAMLAQALRSTTSIRRHLITDDPRRPLPADFGPPLSDGRLRYELLELVGEGATGAVYRAIDRNLSDDGAEATVAIKVFAPPATESLGEWMREEALKARRVTHENVVRALDRGETDRAESYIVYEFIEGGDLGEFIRARKLPLPVREAARLIASVARGVQAIHTAGLVHCDLKPGNIALTRDGQPKVADFGIAMREGQTPRADLSAPGLPLGNLAFISPEQFRGDPGAYSFPSDIYALGAMLAFLVSGELPNGRTPDAIRVRHMAPRPVTLTGRFDPDLSRVIARATDPQPSRRYASAEQLADDLDRWVQRRPLAWGGTPFPRRARLFVHRRPVLTAFAALALLGLATAAAIKLREDLRRNEAIGLIEVMSQNYVVTDKGGENLPILSMWENVADSRYFTGFPISRDSHQIQIFRKLLALPQIADNPDSFDALIVRTGLALALVSREGDYIEAEPLAAACRDRWAELFGADDEMVQRMELIQAAAATNRFLAEARRGEAPDPAEVRLAAGRLQAAEARLPDRDEEGPLPKLIRAQLEKLDQLLPAEP